MKSIIILFSNILKETTLIKYKTIRFVKKYWLESLLISIMALLIFVNLDWRYFASDESYNVTMGQYILKNHGLPKIWDGENIITTINGNDFNDDLICINLNYGAYYITAFMQLIFGKNTYIIRLPFAFMGIFSAIIWYKYFKKITHTGIAKIFLTIYCLSIPLIIYFRNANYFAPSLFFIGLMYLYYKKGEKENKKTLWTLFILFSIIQFHINYMLFIFTIFPILFDYLIARNFKLSFFISYAVIFVNTFPFFLWMRYNFSLLQSEYRSAFLMDFSLGYYRFIEQFWHVSFYIAPIIPLLAIYFVCKLFKKKKHDKNFIYDIQFIRVKEKIFPNKFVISLIFTILFNFVFLCFFTNEFETRYYLAIFPFLYISIAIIIYKLFTIDKLASVIMILLLLFTNVINYIPYNIVAMLQLDMNNNVVRTLISSPIPRSYISDGNQSVSSLDYRSDFIEYISSYSKPVKDSINVIMTYLNENASSEDTVNAFGTESWTNSIQYYTNLRLVNNLRPGFDSWAKDKNYYNADKFYKLVFCPDELVDWVIVSNPLIGEKVNSVNRIYLDSKKYKKIVLKTNLSNMANDIWLYNFGPYNKNETIIIYRKLV